VTLAAQTCFRVAPDSADDQSELAHGRIVFGLAELGSRPVGLSCAGGTSASRAALVDSGSATFVNCELTIELEREAYAVQQAYFVRYGVYRPVGVSMHAVGCGEEVTRAHPEAAN
jgi:hypothetical protein